MPRSGLMAFSLVLVPLAASALSDNFLASRHAPFSIVKGRGCSALVNRGTHFTIDVEVGTPGQLFSVVADTGSNTLIVPSCQCQTKGHCDKSDRCFTGTNRSSTFKLEQDKNGPASMVLSFGSGQIQGVVVQDNVRVGEVESFLEDGLLLMTDRALNTQGPFEGILGLGVPQVVNATEVAEAEAAAANATGGLAPGLQDIINKILGGSGLPGGGEGGGADQVVRGMGGDSSKIIDAASRGHREISNSTMQHRQKPPPPGFLEQAGIETFSMCFNEGSDGVLRLGTRTPEDAHGGVGKQHWGVDFRGVSVGEGGASPAQALFCKPENMTDGQVTPCGAIPDSGTTMLMGPPEHVGPLLESICDNWDRCRRNYTALVNAEEKAVEAMTRIYGMNPFNMKAMTKSDVMQLLLLDCEKWMKDGPGLDELPPLHFHIAGSNGTKQSLTIPSHLYVMESPLEAASHALALLSGVRGKKIPVDVNATGLKAGKVCSPAFGTMDYNTKSNGPVWILGTPLFYEFVVGYDVSTDPPSMAFSPQSETPCGGCHQEIAKGKEPVNFLAARGGYRRLRHPLRIPHAPRLPNIDTTKPL